jgi:hypothetical protein
MNIRKCMEELRQGSWNSRNSRESSGIEKTKIRAAKNGLSLGELNIKRSRNSKQQRERNKKRCKGTKRT